MTAKCADRLDRIKQKVRVKIELADWPEFLKMSTVFQCAANDLGTGSARTSISSIGLQPPDLTFATLCRKRRVFR